MRTAGEIMSCSCALTVRSSPTVREIVRAGSDCWTSTRRGDRLECLLVPVADAVAAFGSGAVAVCLGDGLGGASSVGAAVAGDHDLGIELFVA